MASGAVQGEYEQHVFGGDEAMTLHTGNCRDVMAAMEAESVHAIVTDPPYGMSDIDALDVAECLRAWLAGEDYQHGKRGFMGREWDGWVPGPTIWREAFRVLKPGGHMVVCAAPRVQDLTAIAIRLAGFEIRDCAQWLFGSGFPKSHDVSKAIDRMLGAEREVVGIRTDGCHNTDLSQHKAEGFARSRSAVFEEKGGPVSAAAAAAAAGFGTALKPAHEIALIARKPLDLQSLCFILAQRIVESLCKLGSSANAAGRFSASSRAALRPLGSALWSAAAACSTPADLFALMATLPSGSEIPSSLSIAWSWLVTLEELCSRQSTFTTETKTSLTTDLTTLSCSPSAITPESIIEAAINPSGIGSSAEPVESIFSAARWKAGITLERSARGVVTASARISSQGGRGLTPDSAPIIIARKPFPSTVAACFVEHGTGALNIDACRIPHASEADKAAAAAAAQRLCHDTPGMVMGGLGKTGFTDPRGSVAPYLESMQGGRWPANVMLGCACDGEHDQDCAVRVLDEQSGTSHAGTGTGTGGIFSASTGKPAGDQHGDFGGASRFFYTAKASRSEREAGLEHRARFVATDGRDTPNDTPGRRGVTARANFHPTVKPVSLMRWLVKLVGGKRGNVVLDPFMGSGTTGVACALEGFAFIGVDLDPDHVDIARGRIARAAEDAGTLTAEAAESAPPTAEPRQLGLLPVTP